jgi:DNA-directed RNA polymerase subunit RPC12/RpoP
MRRTPYTCTECGQPILFYEKMPTTAEERHICADCRRIKFGGEEE